MAPNNNDQTSINNHFNSHDEQHMNNYENQEHFIVKHNGKSYDIKRFLKNHPGGVNFVQAFQNKSITHQLEEHHHSPSATYLLKEYEIGGRKSEIRQKLNNNNLNTVHEKNIQEINEDLENLIDWSKPLLSQVSDLGEKYNEWVASPVDRKITLFENPILEMVSISPWYIIPVVWLPVIGYFLYHGMERYTSHVKTVSYVTIVSCIIFGSLLWTLIEYSIHRWVFHVSPSGKSKFLITLHFLLHGLHHKMPFDDRRLVFPPVPAALLFLAFYQIYSFTMPEHLTYFIGAGSIIGYLFYDMTHFYLHYGAPKENTFLYNMKRYHNQHHFVHHNSGFGISNRLWDVIFGTSITLPKLSKALRW